MLKSKGIYIMVKSKGKGAVHINLHLVFILSVAADPLCFPLDTKICMKWVTIEMFRYDK